MISKRIYREKKKTFRSRLHLYDIFENTLVLASRLHVSRGLESAFQTSGFENIPFRGILSHIFIHMLRLHIYRQRKESCLKTFGYV